MDHDFTNFKKAAQYKESLYCLLLHTFIHNLHTHTHSIFLKWAPWVNFKISVPPHSFDSFFWAPVIIMSSFDPALIWELVLKRGNTVILALEESKG